MRAGPKPAADLQSMGCTELTKHLLTLGVPREELDALPRAHCKCGCEISVSACRGKAALLHLWECQQGATAESDDQTVEVSLFNCTSIARGKMISCDRVNTQLLLGLIHSQCPTRCEMLCARCSVGESERQQQAQKLPGREPQCTCLVVQSLSVWLS